MPECGAEYTSLPTRPGSSVPIPMTAFGRVIDYGSPASELSITVQSWPGGMIFPLQDGRTTRQTFLPGQNCGTWSGADVLPSADGFNVKIGLTDYNLSLNGRGFELTTATSAVPSAVSGSPASAPPITSAPSTTDPPSSGSIASPSATSSVPIQRTGLSSGAVAGTAIGCLIAGALIAGLLFWLCLAKRGKPKARDSEGGVLALTTYNKKPTARVVSLESGSLITPLSESDVPQPVEDKIISGEISKICNSIKNHVQSYYHTRPVSPGLIDDDEIQALGHDMPISAGTLRTLLQDSATIEIALRFCIAWVIISKLRGHTEQTNTLLPTEIAQCLRGIGGTEHSSKSQTLLITRWRVITAELLKSAYVRNPFTSSDSRNSSVGATATLLERVLRPYVDPRMDNEERKYNLEELIKRSAQFAFTLFSQPGSWDFDWKEEKGAKSGELCIFPALVQVTDETGELIRPPRPFGEAVVRRLVA
ncbi:hypothetical protein IQ07DRAFT_591125 [Pyrenochaeta sp. DS3sAY3a]|nr:hypothetical protein IQ07DRAFT_591125 [Pyrenochaeta sp. DS3sAY3a]